MSSPQTPSTMLSSLQTSVETTQTELLQNITKHAEKSFSKVTDMIENALKALQPSETTLDRAEHLLGKCVAQAKEALLDAVKKALEDVNLAVDATFNDTSEFPNIRHEARSIDKE